VTVNTTQQTYDRTDFVELEEIDIIVYGCKRCQLWQGAKHGVPGEGPSNAKVMVVGQNPGADEDETGRPFVGRAGKYLTKTLAEFGVKREDLYITNIVKHTSPKNRKPYPDEVAACLPYLLKQIRIIQPKIIVLLGASAKGTPRIDGIEYVEIIHPSAAMRFTKMRERFRLQIAELAKRFGKNT
jgi:uracil-DNA glycosylase